MNETRGLIPIDRAVARSETRAEEAGGQGEGRPHLSQFLEALSSLRGRLIVPFFLLTMLTAVIGVFVVTRLVASSVRERFINQLYEASRVANDSTVRREQQHLAALRLMTFTQGVPEAIGARDSARLTSLLWPLSVNENADAVIVLDDHGVEIMGLTRVPGTANFERTAASDLSSLPLVRAVLHDEPDPVGDKFVGVVTTASGTFLFTSAPVHSSDGDLVGALLLGTRLERLAAEMKQQSLADVILLDSEGKLIGSTLAEPEAGYGVIELPSADADALSTTDIREVNLYGRSYQVLYSPWLIRRELHGILGIVLPSNFVVTAEATSRNAFSLIFSIGAVAVIFTGYVLAQSIARPLLRLRSMAQAVAAGNLDQSTGLHRRDEIGDLASAFDVMTARLHARTAEAERLYAEAIDRNKQLAEMYDRLQKAQRQLIQSEKLAAIGQLAAGIVHDVKNPLAVIKGMAEELMLEQEADPEAQSDLTVIRDSATRASKIVSDLLKFARESSTRMERRDLRETVEGSLRLTDYLLRKGKVRVKQTLPDNPVWVTYDAQQMEQVLINLIQNGVQAMPDGGHIRISLEPEESQILLSVADTGLGIAEENLRRVFEPFFTTKPEGQGTGMGLSVSYGIVSRHGGSIDVLSEPGGGTTFVICLPYEPPAEAVLEGGGA